MKKTVLSIQHLLAMFGATVLVPILTGFNPSVAIFCAGIGTLIFHFCTEGKVPVFLGSSFAFIPLILSVKEAFNGDYLYLPEDIDSQKLIKEIFGEGPYATILKLCICSSR